MSGMNATVPVWLDDETAEALEAEARSRGVALADLLADLATAEAHRLRRERIRAQRAAVAAYVASNPEARAFCEDWGTPTTVIGGDPLVILLEATARRALEARLTDEDVDAELAAHKAERGARG